METTLHRELKTLYAAEESQREVTVDGYRIDGIVDGTLFEIQCASLYAFRDKIACLLEKHDVHIVKPLAARKYLITRKNKRGKIISSRYSPKRETVYHLFDELVHFVRVFPHPRLTLEVLLTEQEEHRLPKKKRHAKSRGFKVFDRSLRSVSGRHVFQTADDLADLLPEKLPDQFTTAEIAKLAKIPRWLAQKFAYCLRMIELVKVVGKRGNAILYQRTTNEIPRPTVQQRLENCLACRMVR
jgi:hypothetical protein